MRANNMPGRVKSAAYFASPVTFASASLRAAAVPMTFIAETAFGLAPVTCRSIRLPWASSA